MKQLNMSLTRKWRPVLEAGTKIEKDSIRKSTAIVLETAYQTLKKHGLLTEAGPNVGTSVGSVLGKNSGGAGGYMSADNGYMNSAIGDTGTGNFYMPQLVMPLIRRVFPQLIAHELVGVQPLKGPMGIAIALRARYLNKNQSATEGGEVAYHPVDTGFSGVTPDAKPSMDVTPSTMFPHSTDINFPGTKVTNDGNTAAVAPSAIDAALNHYLGDNKWYGQGIDTLDGEFKHFSEYNKMGIDFIKTSVEAKTRKLGASWSLELAEDLQAMHGINIENEYTDLISYEIGAEIDRQILSEMCRAALGGRSVTKWSPAKADGIDQMGRLATLMTQVSIEAQNIAIRTRRGAANFVVASPRVSALLEQLTLNKFVSMTASKNAPSVPDTGVGALTKTGMLNDGRQLLVTDAYANNDYILMGYKGKDAVDAGIIYMPYIPVQLQKVLDPETFTPRIGARTRYGIMNNVWDARNYYHFIQIDDLSQTYTWGGNRQFLQEFTVPGNNSGNPIWVTT